MEFRKITKYGIGLSEETIDNIFRSGYQNELLRELKENPIESVVENLNKREQEKQTFGHKYEFKITELRLRKYLLVKEK